MKRIWISVAGLLLAASACWSVNFADITQPKKLYIDTEIVSDSQAQAIIVSPSAPAWMDLAGEVSEAIQKATGVALPIHAAGEIDQDQLQSSNAIMLGDVGGNRKLLYPYSHGLIFADGRYPGRGGFDLRSVHDPWGTGHNIISIGASDVDGARAGVKTLTEYFDKRDALTLGRVHHVSLGGEARHVDWGADPARGGIGWHVTEGEDYEWGDIFTQQLDEQWMEAWKARCENHLENYGTRGLFAMAGWVGRTYAVTRRQPYAKLFVWMINRTYTFRQSSRTTADHSWGMDSDFHIYEVIPAWDAVEEAPDLSEEDRLSVTKILFQWVSEVGAPKGNPNNDHVRHNHWTFPALGCLYAGQYFNRYYDAAEGQKWINIADSTFRPQVAATKPDEDCNSYQWLTLYHVLRYALARPDLTYFKIGHARTNADYAILTMNNLGYQVPYGDTSEWALIGNELPILRIAEWYYGTGKYQWVLDKKVGDNPPPALGDFQPDPSHAVKPWDLRGAGVWPLDDWFQKTTGWEEYNPVPRPKAFDKVAFRNGFAPDNQYLLLDGLTAGSHGHSDGNAVLQWTENGRIWLADADYTKSQPRYHNTLILLRNGQTDEMPGFCSLSNFVNLDTLAASHTVTPNYASADWHRYVVWPKGRMFIVIDRVKARMDAEYSLRPVWRTIGDVELDGANLDVDQGGQHARIAMTPDTRCLLSSNQKGNWRSYPWADFGVIHTMQGIRNANLEKDESATVFTVLHASGSDKSTVRVTRISENMAAVTDGDSTILVAVPDSTGQIRLGDLLSADADLLVVSGGSLYAAGLREMSISGQSYTPAQAVDVEVDIETGKASIRLPAVTDTVTNPLDDSEQLSVPVSVGEIDSIIDRLVTNAPEPTTGGPEIGDLPNMPVRWKFPSEAENGSTDGAMHFTCVRAADVDADGSQEIIAGDKAGWVHCLGADGELLWDFDTGTQVDAVAAVDFDNDGRPLVLVGGVDGHLFALDARGVEKWMFQMPHHKVAGHIKTIFPADLNGDGDEVAIVGGANWRYYAIDAHGEEIWHHPVLHSASVGTAADINDDGGDEIVAGTNYHIWHTLNAQGSKIWRATPLGGPGLNAVDTGDIDGDGTYEVLYGGADTFVQAVDNEGNRIWTFSTGGEVTGISATDVNGDGADEVIATSGSFNVYCIDGKGQLVWRQDLGLPLNDLAVLEDDAGWHVVAGCDDGNAYLLAGDTGDINAVFAAGEPVKITRAATCDDSMQIIIGTPDGPLCAAGRP